jgi:PAS domain S-box-containing protein
MSKGSILVVDDNLESLRLLADILTMEGYQVRPANSGELALASVAANPPELILLDIRMPGMDGFEALRRLKAREESRDIPVIFLSAVTETAQRVGGFKLGAVDFISKPFQRDELLARVQTHLELFRLRNQLEHQAVDLRLANEQLQIAKITELKQAEELLRESQLRFRSTFEQAAVGIAHVAPDGRWLDVNQRLCDIVGYTREELLEIRFQDITHPDDLGPDLAYVRQLLAGAIPNFSMQKRYIRKDGQIEWVNLTVALVRRPDGEPDYFISVVEDITGRKLAEKRLHESEDRFRTLVETADDAIILMDMDLNRIYENEASWAGLGYTLEEWKKLGPWWERIHPDDIDLIKEKTGELFKTGASGSKYRIRRKDGHYVTRLAKSKVIHSDGKPVAVLAILRDITEMERAEEALRESERKYRQLTEQASEGIFVVDKQGRYLEVNPAGLEMVGYSLEELREMTIPDLMTPDELKKTPSRFPEILAGKAIVSERTLLRKDGSLFLAELTAKLMPDGNVLATKRDITERKRAQEALLHSERKYRSLFTNMRNGFAYCKMIFDENNKPVDWIYLEVNDEFERMTGLKKEAVEGKRVTEVFTGIADFRPNLFEIYGQVALTGEGTEFTINFDILNVWLGISVYSPEKGFFVAVFDDVTERKKAEEDIRERMRHAEFVAEIGMVLTESGSMGDALGKCCASMVNNLDAAFARIWTFNETENMLELQASAGMYTHIDGGHSRVPVGALKIGLIAQERKPHITNQVVGDPRVGDQEWAKREGMVAFAGYPLVIDEKLIGVVAMFSRKPLSEMTMRMLRTAAYEIALGIEHRTAAYSEPSRAVIPTEAGHPFRLMAGTDSDLKAGSFSRFSE